MSDHHHDGPVSARCCPCVAAQPPEESGLDRRTFLGAAALGGVALSGLTWSALAAAGDDLPAAPARKPLVVKPVFVYSTYTPRPQTSWRPWGGIQTQADADQELTRIQGDLEKLKAQSDFPLDVLPVAAVQNTKQLDALADVAGADALLIFAAGGRLDDLPKLGKHVIIFIRHQSGPLYLWYEIVSPRFLRQHTDQQKIEGIEPDDVVIDRLDEVLWRLRALGGLKNTLGGTILAVGGPGGWAQPKGVVPDLVRKVWKLDIRTLDYKELGPLIAAARQDPSTAALAKRRADAYLKLPQTTLETDREYVEKAFVLEQVFRRLMAEAGCRAMTINSCMGTIMPLAETTACLPLSTLNDDGYLAFCESDFVVIPSGMLLGAIAGKPTFLNDPTYPHDGLVTLAHCTAPRKMDGTTREPTRILTHFESDYGAAPKVEMRRGQKVTNVAPDFAAQRWVGFLGEIADAPFLPICRSQIEVRFTCSAQQLAQRMPGFHWMTIYGDYLREIGYALKKVPIAWECLT